MNMIPHTLFVVAVIAASFTTIEAADKTHPVVREFATKSGVRIQLISDTALRIESLDKDSKSKLDAKLADGFRMVLLTVPGDKPKLDTMHVVTFQPAVKDKKAPAWPVLRAVDKTKVQRIKAGTPLLVKPVWGTLGNARVLAGFELIGMPATAGTPKDDDLIQRTKEEVDRGDPARVVKLKVEIPGGPQPGQVYGVALTPVWKEKNRALAGYDVQLVATPMRAK